jgi:hypothetical protein
MNLKRTAAFGVGGAALAALIAGAATPARRPLAPNAPTRPTPIDLHGAELAEEVSRLRERLRPTAEPQSSRNLFEFYARPRVAAATLPIVPDQAPTDDLPDAPLAPTAALVGITEDAGPDGPIRTAVLAVDEEVVLAKVGDVAGARYRVTAVSAIDVELADQQTGTTVRLRLR